MSYHPQIIREEVTEEIRVLPEPTAKPYSAMFSNTEDIPSLEALLKVHDESSVGYLKFAKKNMEMADAIRERIEELKGEK